jgi:hypothetical protein
MQPSSNAGDVDLNMQHILLFAASQTPTARPNDRFNTTEMLEVWCHTRKLPWDT